MAPSPTGYLHLGHAKAYLVNYALARSLNGTFILRIEDTDQKRNKMETITSMIRDCKWLGIDYDKGPAENGERNEYFQSTRFDIYKKYINQLLAEGRAYKAYETPEERAVQIQEQRQKGKAPVYSGAHANLTKEEQEAFEAEGRKPIVRLRVPKNQVIEVDDKIYGKVRVNTDTIGDMPIQKSDGTPMYNFCVVIDDHLMGITDVVRGFEHLSNTAKQIVVYNTFGWEFPSFAHFSSLLNEDGQGKLSKRKGAKAIAQYRAEGYLPEAIFNYIMVVSCSFTFQNKDQEIMSREEIYSKLSYDKVLKTNARFNAEKLDWFNGQHIRRLSTEGFYKTVIDWLENDAKTLTLFDENFDSTLVDLFLDNKETLKQALPLIQPRINKLVDIFSQLKFLFIKPGASNIDVTPVNHTRTEFENAVSILYNKIASLPIPWTHEEWEKTVRATGDELGWKHADLFMALRVGIVGDRFSPPLFEAMEILGRDESLARLCSCFTNNNN